MNGWFLSRFERVRVRVFKRRREKRGRKRKVLRKWRGTGWKPFIYVLGSGWPKPDPLSPILGRLIKILMDLDQSNVPGALAWSGSIRSVGLGFLPTGFWFSFNFLSFSCYVHPCVCYLDLLCALISSQNSKKNAMCSWYVCDCFCDIFTCAKLIKGISVNFPFNWYVVLCLCESPTF